MEKTIGSFHDLKAAWNFVSPRIKYATRGAVAIGIVLILIFGALQFDTGVKFTFETVMAYIAMLVAFSAGAILSDMQMRRKTVELMAVYFFEHTQNKGYNPPVPDEVKAILPVAARDSFKIQNRALHIGIGACMWGPMLALWLAGGSEIGAGSTVAFAAGYYASSVMLRSGAILLLFRLALVAVALVLAVFLQQTKGVTWFPAIEFGIAAIIWAAAANDFVKMSGSDPADLDEGPDDDEDVSNSLFFQLLRPFFAPQAIDEGWMFSTIWRKKLLVAANHTSAYADVFAPAERDIEQSSGGLHRGQKMDAGKLAQDLDD